MRFIFHKCYEELRTNKAIIDKMMFTVDQDKLDSELKNAAEDYCDMYSQFMSKIVSDSRSTVYNGDAMNDWFKGKHGNKMQGLIALREFSRMITSGISKTVRGK